MHIPGHLAIALTQHRLPPFYRRKNSLIPLLVAALAPDVVDKTIGHILHLMPNGRHIAHNLFALAGSSIIMTVVAGRSSGLSWFVGYAGHLLADYRVDMPWFYPAKAYPFKERSFSFGWQRFRLELIFLLVALVFYKGSAPKFR